MEVDVITMGCSKNLVDSERLLGLFAAHGVRAHHNPARTHGGVAVVNTCGFIADAKEESIRTILELVGQKEAGLLQKVVVMGCLSERYMDELRREIPGVDAFYGKFNWQTLPDALHLQSVPVRAKSGRVVTTPRHYAYLKISEGCDRRCAYCAIPLITGRHRSRPFEEILAEARQLVAGGAKELQVIAQELTAYGTDRYGRRRLPELVEALADVPGVEWIRLHYAYPTHFPLSLLPVMREHANVCRYLDLALQHISDNVLQRMQRHVTKAQTMELLATLRREVPGLCLRTTLMVGFPGETEEDFRELLDFVREVRFERMGAFAYSEEEGTYAARHYADNVPQDVKENRLERLMAVQQEISAELNAAKVGKTLRTLIDRRDGDYFVGRTEYDSPDVDGEVLIPADEALSIGRFYDVKITAADDYDLYGTTQTKPITREQQGIHQ